MPKRPHHRLLIVPMVLALAACGPTVTAPTVPAGTGPAGTSQASTNEPAPSPSGPSPSGPTGAPPQAGQTDTEWGRIWDTVPAGFPTFPGSTPADDASAAPASGRYVVENGDAREIAAWMQAALETALYRTEGLSGPLENGGFVLASVGEGACRIRTTVAPLGAMTFVTVLYGAACPTG